MGLFIEFLLLLGVLLNLPSESTGCDELLPCIQCSNFDWCSRAFGFIEGREAPQVECAQQNWPLDMYMTEYNIYYNNAKTDCVRKLLGEEQDFLVNDMHEFIPWALKKSLIFGKLYEGPRNFSILVYGTADRFHQSVHRLRQISITYSGQFERNFIGHEKDYSSFEINSAYRAKCCLTVDLGSPMVWLGEKALSLFQFFAKLKFW